MKVKTIEIAWHEKKPIYSLEFGCPTTLFTAGADNYIKVSKYRYLL